MIYAPRSMYRPETSLQKKVKLSKYCGDVRNKTFFTHVMPENYAIVSKSAFFTHARSLAAW